MNDRARGSTSSEDDMTADGCLYAADSLPGNIIDAPRTRFTLNETAEEQYDRPLGELDDVWNAMSDDAQKRGKS